MGWTQSPSPSNNKIITKRSRRATSYHPYHLNYAIEVLGGDKNFHEKYVEI
jgi:hypothetical protein